MRSSICSRTSVVATADDHGSMGAWEHGRSESAGEVNNFEPVPTRRCAAANRSRTVGIADQTRSHSYRLTLARVATTRLEDCGVDKVEGMTFEGPCGKGKGEGSGLLQCGSPMQRRSADDAACAVKSVPRRRPWKKAKWRMVNVGEVWLVEPWVSSCHTWRASCSRPKQEGEQS